MATYKVLQDIEAEDKLIGPLTLKQCLFAGATCVGLFIEFKIVTAGALGVVRWPLVIIILLPIIVSGFLAAPISRDQPNDIWLLARLRFFVKPHRRIWDQNGTSKLVTVTAPVRMELPLTNGLSQDEVHSRLQALADTLDSRGWAVKNVSVNMYAQPGYLSPTEETDRLVAVSSLPQDVPTANVSAADDIMDTKSNPLAHQLDDMITAASQAHLQSVAQRVQQAQSNGSTNGSSAGQSTAGQPTDQPATDYWFMHQQDASGAGGSKNSGSSAAAAVPADYAVFNSQVVAPGTDDSAALPKPTAEEEALIQQVRAEQRAPSAWKAHMHTIQPLGGQQAAPSTPQAPPKLDGYTRHDSTGHITQNPVPQQATPARPAASEPEIPKLFGSGTEKDIPPQAAALLFGASLPPEHQVSMEVLRPQGPPAQISAPQNPTPQLVNSFPSAANPAASSASGQTGQNPAILQLAHNDDLNVATIARQANAIARDGSNEEVVISLH